MESQEERNRKKMERAFAESEACLRREGLEPPTAYYAAKQRALDGKIDFEQAIEELTAFQRQMGYARKFTEDNKDVLRALAGTDPEFEEEMKIAREIMQRHRRALGKLADS